MNSRENALLILNKAEEDKIFINLALKNFLKCDNKRDKAFATELVYGVTRYKITLDYIIDKFCTLKNIKVRNILRTGAYQILYMDKVPVVSACDESVKLAKKYAKEYAGLVNAVIRKLSEKTVVLPDSLSLKYSFPQNITDVIERTAGKDKTEEILINLNKNKGLSARVNNLKSNEEEFLNLLKEKEIEYIKTDLCFNLKKSGNELDDAFDRGVFTWQGEESAKTVKLLSPEKGERILDICSAPGGKSCFMAELMENDGEIISCDLYEHRTKLIENTANRLGVHIINTKVNDGSVYNESLGVFDRVLADVPCSGLGVIAKKPDIKYANQDFDALADLQYKILKNAVKYVKKGGVVVYSTCTINKTENENVVKRLLNENKSVVLDSEFITVLPGEFSDGFFMCRLRKINDGESKA